MVADDSASLRVFGRPLSPAHLFLLIVALAAAVRLVFFASYTHLGTDCDGAGYMNLAENISRGAGWVNNSLRVLFVLPDSLPQPDAHWSPLYPLLTALSYKLFGVSHASAKLVPFLFGMLTPGLIALLARRLAGSTPAGLVAGVVAALHPTLVTWSLRIETEIVSTFFVALSLWLVLSRDVRGRAVLVGVTLGLAYLLKYQNVLLWPAVLLFFAVDGRRPDRIRNLGVAILAALVVVSPWLIRNAVVFGDPFYSLPRYFLIARYLEFGGPQRFVALPDPPPDGLAYVAAHLQETLGLMRVWFRSLPELFIRTFGGSWLLVPLVGLGLLSAWRRPRRWAPPLAYAVLLVLAAAPTAEIRYVLVLIPIWLALAAAGWSWAASWPRLARARVWRVALVLLVAVVVLIEARSTVLLAGDRDHDWCPAANYCAVEAEAAAAFVQAKTTPDETVFACEPWHFTLACRRNVVSIPFDEAQLRDLGERYRIRYLVIAERDLAIRLPGWIERPPVWAEEVARIPAEDIERPARAPDYDRVSTIRIYALSIINW